MNYSEETRRMLIRAQDSLFVKEIMRILDVQDTKKVENFIVSLCNFTNDLDESDISIQEQPFNKTKNRKQTKEYIQLSGVYEASKDLMKAQNPLATTKASKKLAKTLRNCTDPQALKRLCYYLKVPHLNLVFDELLAMRVFCAANRALYHGECTRTGGRPDYLTEVEKMKLRRLKLLFKQYFPDLSNKLRTETNIIYEMGCHLIGKSSLGKYPDEAIKQNSLTISNHKKK